MSTFDEHEFNRLILQIERDLIEKARLRMLLSNADVTTSGHRGELRAVKARLTRIRKRTPAAGTRPKTARPL